MDLILFNARWMSYNIFLATLPILLGFLFLRVEKPIYKISIFILWLIFLPNTIYLVTDMKYFLGDFFAASGYYKIVLTLQYIALLIFGIITFVLALYPLDRALSKKKSKLRDFKIILLILINYLIAFGVALGRIQRVNSWDVFFNLKSVYESSFILLNMKGIFLIIFIFGSFSSFIYFTAARILRNK